MVMELSCNETTTIKLFRLIMISVYKLQWMSNGVLDTSVKHMTCDPHIATHESLITRRTYGGYTSPSPSNTRGGINGQYTESLKNGGNFVADSGGAGEMKRGILLPTGCSVNRSKIVSRYCFVFWAMVLSFLNDRGDWMQTEN